MSAHYHITAARVEHTYGRVRSVQPAAQGLLEAIPPSNSGGSHNAAARARRHAKRGQAVLLTGPGEFRPRLYRPGARARSCGWAYEVQCGCGHWQIPDPHGQPVPRCADCETALQRERRLAEQEAEVRRALESGCAPAEVYLPLAVAAPRLGLRPETLRCRVKAGRYPGAIQSPRPDGKGVEWRIPLSEISSEISSDSA